MALILIVDDEEPIRILVREALEPRGHTIIVASSGKEALKLCDQSSFDLVITDIVMPEMDGLELIRSLREKQVDILVLTISGAMNAHFSRAALLLGARTLDKPFTVAELVSAVDTILVDMKRETSRERWQ